MGRSKRKAQQPRARELVRAGVRTRWRGAVLQQQTAGRWEDVLPPPPPSPSGARQRPGAATGRNVDGA